MADRSLREHQRAAAKRRWSNLSDTERIEALRPATEAAAAKRRQAAVERLVAQAPPLTAEQLAELRVLLNGGSDAPVISANESNTARRTGDAA